MTNVLKKYVLNLTQISKDDSELVGIKAVSIKEIISQGILVSKGFSVTNTAFDDYLIANDLIGLISEKINGINYSDASAVVSACEDIQASIIKGTMPEIIKKPVIKAYLGLSGLTESHIMLRVSGLNADLDESNYSQNAVMYDVFGEEDLIASIKKLWSMLFTPEALKYRNLIGYEGYLTVGVIVQKVPNPEVSGRVYSQSLLTGDKDTIEVQAIYGLEYPGLTGEIVPDSYFCVEEPESISEKKIVEQEWMFVRSGGKRTSGEESLTRVPISKAWNRKQKLDDKHVLNLVRIQNVLKGVFKKNLEISFVVEGGEICITGFVALEQENKVKSNKLQEMSDKVLKEPKELSTKLKETPKLKPELKPKPKSTSKPKKKSITDYVKEVRSDKKYPEKSRRDGSKVEVSLSPVSRLTKVAEGGGNDRGLSFGLVHFIFSENDWDNLTGDEILVIDTLEKFSFLTLNSVKGIVFTKAIPKDISSRIKVPMIHSVLESFETLKENAVVTVDSTTGSIYLGAGKEDEVADEEIEAMPETTILGPEAPVDKVTEAKEPDVETPDIKASKEEFNEFGGIHEAKVKQVKTSSNFIQLFDPKNPNINLINFNGAYVSIEDYFKSASIHPRYVISNAGRRRNFMEKIVNQLKHLLTGLDGKPLILAGNDMAYDEMDFLRYGEEVKRESRTGSRVKLLDTPKLLNFELELLSVVRNRESLKNIWYAIPIQDSSKYLVGFKKAIASFGFRRSTTFNLFGLVSNTLTAIAIKEMVSIGLDGFIIDLDSLLLDIYKGKPEKIDGDIINFLGWVVHIINSNNADAYLLSKDTQLHDDLVEKLIKNGLLHYVLPLDNISKNKKLIAHHEIKKLTKKKKRGRRKKKVDYGF